MENGKFSSNFIKLTDEYWFKNYGWCQQKPYKVLEYLGIFCNEKRAEELFNLNDLNYNSLYYVQVACNGFDDDESIKLILGPVAEILNEKNISLERASSLIPPYFINIFVKYLKQNKIERSFLKEIFRDFIFHERFKIDEEGLKQQLSANNILEKILSDSKYSLINSNDLDSLIDEIISLNREQTKKVKENPKLIQWFLGQVIKNSKKKLIPTIVKEKLESKLLS